MSTETTYGLLWMGVNVHRNHIWLIVDGGQRPQKPHMAYWGGGGGREPMNSSSLLSDL